LIIRLVIPHRCILEEFRVQVIEAHHNLWTGTQFILDVDGNQLVAYQINSSDMSPNANLLFNLNKFDTDTPGAIVHVDLLSVASNPTRTSHYQFSMWGTYIR